jgi:hypothetical protein
VGDTIRHPPRLVFLVWYADLNRPEEAMKLPTKLLQTLAVAVASLGAAGCGAAVSNEPTNPSPDAPGVVEPQGNCTPQEGATGGDQAIKPKDDASPDNCPACGRG